jgi:hypothetical protein
MCLGHRIVLRCFRLGSVYVLPTYSVLSPLPDFSRLATF